MSNRDRTVAAALDPADALYAEDLSTAEAEAGVCPPLPALPVARASALDATEARLCAAVRGRSEERIALLGEAVEICSGSRHTPGVEAMHALLGPRLETLGLSAERHPAASADATGLPFGPHRVYRQPGEGPRALLCGHVDTVFAPGCGFERAEIRGERMHGPGCADMKGGLVVMISALESLAACGLLAGRPLSLVLNGDEEVSSRGSRPLLEVEAREATLGLVFEPGRPEPWGAVTVARKGVGAWQLRVQGQAAHSGNRYIDGVSAVDELARKVVALARLTDLRRGRTVNVGVLRTGSGATRNTVAAEALAEFDLRVTDAEDAAEAVAAIEAIAARQLVHNPWTDARARSELIGGLARPPMPCTPARQELYGQVAGLAELLGLRFGAVSVGGGSDANLIAAGGLLALDGLGPVGGGLHTHDEWVDLPSLTERSLLTALLLHRLWTGRL